MTNASKRSLKNHCFFNTVIPDLVFHVPSLQEYIFHQSSCQRKSQNGHERKCTCLHPEKLINDRCDHRMNALLTQRENIEQMLWHNMIHSWEVHLMRKSVKPYSGVYFIIIFYLFIVSVHFIHLKYGMFQINILWRWLQ